MNLFFFFFVFRDVFRTECWNFSALRGMIATARKNSEAAPAARDVFQGLPPARLAHMLCGYTMIRVSTV